jgi:putative peptidoglycan lipid II flippase
MQTGAAASIYYGERFYQLPVGILGVAIATVIYPLLARHAARRDHGSLSTDLTLGLRLVVFTALPAGIGIMLLAHPITKVLFQRGEFTSQDAERAARMIAGYSSGVWAYCALPLLVRGFYAVGNRTAPVRLGLVAVAVNLALNLTLIWPLAELGLAVSTAAAAVLQVALLTITFSRAVGRLAWWDLAVTCGKSAIAAAVMTVAVVVARHAPFLGDGSRGQQAAQLALAISAGAAAYLATARLLAMSELRLLLVRPTLAADETSSHRR